MFDKKKFNLYLGSGSPRRKELLSFAGIPFTQKYIDVEELYPSDLEAEKVPEYLAHLKAEAGKQFLSAPEDILLTADTIVIHKGEILGKPVDEEDAFNMLKRLSDEWHTVITGVVLTSLAKSHVFSARSEVLFDQISNEEIRHYIQQWNPLDKAGAYGIQDWIGWAKIKRIEGLYSNIMGLPVQMVYHALLKF